MGRLVSDLLAQALRENAGPATGPPPVWISRPMGARADLSDKEALYRAPLDNGRAISVASKSSPRKHHFK